MNRVLIVDDETPARSELRYVLEQIAPAATILEAGNGSQALALVEEEPVDVAFLDINMPGIDGLELAATLMDDPHPPLIVFATAYDQHALRAFELAALDYVVKPFDERRLARTVERVEQALAERTRFAEHQAALQEYLREARPTAGLTKLWGQRENETRVLVDYADVLWLVAKDKHVYARTAAGEELLVRQTLKELASRLADHSFARVHKSYVVNLDHVAEVVPWFSGTYLIRMDDQARTEIPMSRRYAVGLKKLVGW